MQALEAVEPAGEKELVVHTEQAGVAEVSPYEPAGHSHALQIEASAAISGSMDVAGERLNRKDKQAYPMPLAGLLEVLTHKLQVKEVSVGMPPYPGAHLLQ
jgi:hypothetical protein